MKSIGQIVNALGRPMFWKIALLAVTMLVAVPVQAKPAAPAKKQAKAKAQLKPPTATTPKPDAAASNSKSATGKSDSGKSGSGKSNVASALGLDKKTSSEPKGPLYITSKTLNLDSKGRTFTYRGDVKAVQDDLTITSEVMVGEYDEKNQVKIITCYDNVVVTRGDTMRASSNRAVYNVPAARIDMTENPELSNNGSDLSADKVIIYVNEDRSDAEGNVRVKVTKTDSANTGGIGNQNKPSTPPTPAEEPAEKTPAVTKTP